MPAVFKKPYAYDFGTSLREKSLILGLILPETVTRNAVEQQRKTALEISATIMEAANGSSAIANAMNAAFGLIQNVINFKRTITYQRIKIATFHLTNIRHQIAIDRSFMS
jgi:hypothetical protein